MDLYIKNGFVYTDNHFSKLNIGIDNGKIVMLTDTDVLTESVRVIDAAGKYVIPGSIDTHVHLRAPSNNKRETFLSGTMAAAAGGTTTIVEQPICNPPQYSKETLAYRKEFADREACVDYAFYGAAGCQYPEKIKEIASEGIVGYKTFLQAPSEDRKNEFTNLYMDDDAKLFYGMKTVAETGKLLMVHAENHVIIDENIKRLRQKGEQTGKAHVVSRPNFTEYEVISKIIQMAKITGTTLFFAHVSTPESMELIKKAREDGQKVFCETCVHYLTLDDSALEKYGPFAKCNPPMRTLKDQEKMWEYVNNGVVDSIGSDHSPFLYEEKAVGFDDIFLAPAGLVGIDLRLPLMINEAIEGKLSMETLVQVMCEKPAKVLGIYPEKGTISIGSDADLTIFDTNDFTVVDNKKSYSNSRESQVVYNGVTLKGHINYTIVRGRVVMENDVVTEANAGYGKMVSPLD